ncbi:hypothetical protein [Polyangium jinanense]|uniref:Uncharacterized protein n=1 Tax=Polyangium jinanense TaxID=2829994 RepID=A0A9X4AQG8_9BACT|nr:hypothetical protein [Polyangium jinanense]MDC3981083.1 hypothetical protein [Polyangium jinanense]
MKVWHVSGASEAGTSLVVETTATLLISEISATVTDLRRWTLELMFTSTKQKQDHAEA